MALVYSNWNINLLKSVHDTNYHDLSHTETKSLKKKPSALVGEDVT